MHQLDEMLHSLLSAALHLLHLRQQGTPGAALVLLVVSVSLATDVMVAVFVILLAYDLVHAVARWVLPMPVLACGTVTDSVSRDNAATKKTVYVNANYIYMAVSI